MVLHLWLGQPPPIQLLSLHDSAAADQDGSKGCKDAQDEDDREDSVKSRRKPRLADSPLGMKVFLDEGGLVL